MKNSEKCDARVESNLSWQEVDDHASWDRMLVELGGHPLQSALWGNARRQADGVMDRRFLYVQLPSGEPLMMVRMELRKIPLLGNRVGWIPRGPAVRANIPVEKVGSSIRSLPEPPMLVVTDLWRRNESGQTGTRPETIWIDLSAGEEALWSQLDKRVRHGIRKAGRDGVTIEQSRSPSDLGDFLSLLRQLRAVKGYDSALSESLYAQLLCSSGTEPVAAYLFVARLGDAFAGAALILQSGSNVHYFSGGTDRRFGKFSIGETLHWSIIQWAIARGAVRYDLEGIDRLRNPGTFAFKRKLGGEIILLSGKEYHANSALGGAIALFDRLRDRSRLVAAPLERQVRRAMKESPRDVTQESPVTRHV